MPEGKNRGTLRRRSNASSACFLYGIHFLKHRTTTYHSAFSFLLYPRETCFAQYKLVMWWSFFLPVKKKFLCAWPIAAVAAHNTDVLPYRCFCFWVIVLGAFIRQDKIDGSRRNLIILYFGLLGWCIIFKNFLTMRLFQKGIILSFRYVSS